MGENGAEVELSVPSRPRDPSSLLMAIAMSGATCLLLGLAISLLEVPRAQRRVSGPRNTQELDVQLETVAALPPSPLISAAVPTPATIVTARAKPVPNVLHTTALVLTEPQAGDADSTADNASVTTPGDTHGSGGGPTTPAPPEPELEIIPFGPGMTPPRQLHGPSPAYTAQALASRVQGKTLIRCVIEAAGSVRDCRVIKPLPILDEATCHALLASRFAPATFRGRAVSVSYLFTFDFKLP